MAHHVGEPVGEWELEERLGAGAFGEVWRARPLGRAGPCAALKLPRDDRARALLRREATAQARLESPRFPRVLGLHPEEPAYIAFEFVDGASVRGLLRESGALPLSEAVRVAREVLLALEDAHAAGLVHRDLKPDNVLVASDGRVVVTDLGLSVLPELDLAHSLANDDAIVAAGSAPYMAPEARGGGAPDARADLYAWGVVLFEMLTGALPGAAELPSNTPGVPEAIDGVYVRACSRREARYASAADARAALDEALVTASVAAGPDQEDADGEDGDPLSSVVFYMERLLSLAQERFGGVEPWACIHVERRALLRTRGGPFAGSESELETVRQNLEACYYLLASALAEVEANGDLDRLLALDACWAMAVFQCLVGSSGPPADRARALEAAAGQAIDVLLELFADGNPEEWDPDDPGLQRFATLHAMIARARRDLLGRQDDAMAFFARSIRRAEAHPLARLLVPLIVAECAAALDMAGP